MERYSRLTHFLKNYRPQQMMLNIHKAIFTFVHTFIKTSEKISEKICTKLMQYLPLDREVTGSQSDFNFVYTI
jgi:hypothetical protein